MFDGADIAGSKDGPGPPTSGLLASRDVDGRGSSGSNPEEGIGGSRERVANFGSGSLIVDASEFDSNINSWKVGFSVVRRGRGSGDTVVSFSLESTNTLTRGVLLLSVI